MSRRAGFFLTALLVLFAPLFPEEARSQSNSHAAELLEQTVNSSFLPNSQYQSRRSEIIAEARRALVATSERSQPIEWGVLQVVLSMNLSSMDRQAAAQAADQALRVLSPGNAPAPWAFAQQQRMSGLFNGPAAGGRMGDASAIDEAAQAALSVFTIDAYPYEHLMVRCQKKQLDLVMSGDIAAMTSPVLQEVCNPLRRLTGGGLPLDGVRGVMLSGIAASHDHASPPFGVNDLGSMNATALSAVLDLAEIGLGEEQLRRARSLRAQADAALSETSGSDAASLRGNLQFWRANAALLSLLEDASLGDASALIAGNSRFEGAVLAPIILDGDKGLVVIQRTDGAGGVQMLPGADVGATASQLRAPQIGAALEAWGRDYRNGDLGGALAGFRDNFERQWGAALHASARRAGLRSGDRLLILSDGPASGLPIGLLRDPQTGRMLVEEYELVFTPSLSAYEASLRRSRIPRPASLVAVVAPEAGLPSARSEALIALHAFGPSALLLDQARKPEILDALRHASYWQFSTHGDFNWISPRLSGLMLPQGERLTLSDLYFAEEPLGAPNLVILSACETALFDSGANANDFVGLPAGFIQAGAAGVVGSLWEVSDVSTALMISRFYELHLNQGLRPSAALRQAQLWLRDATREELQAYVEALERRSAIPADEADWFFGALAESPDQQPFADPRHWGAWVYFGA